MTDCDVCGQRIPLLPVRFVALGRPGTACGTCARAVERFNVERNVEVLPEGPMRAAITEMVSAETAFACLDALLWLRSAGGSVDFREGYCAVTVRGTSCIEAGFLEACARARAEINPSPADSGQSER